MTAAPERSTATDWLPGHQFSEHHQIVIDATPAAVEQALRAVSLAELPVVRALWALRRLPASLGRRPAPARTAGPFLAEISRVGVILVDQPGRFVAGLGGKFWRLRGGDLQRFRSPEEFVAWKARESCKATLEFAWSDASPVVLETTTLVHAPDAPARRSFARYWRLIRPASGLTRILLLRAVKRRAEAERPAA